jgi:hypothetical protein
MRKPDQDERPESGADDSLGGGYGSVDTGDLNDGYGTTSFYDDTYDPIDPDETYDADETFGDAAGEDGGFGSADDGSTAGDGDGLGEVVPVGSEVSEDEAENILEEILDDIFGDDADDVVDDMQTASGMDAGEILDTLDDVYADEGFGTVDIPDDGGVVDNPFDGADSADVADFVSQSDFDLNIDGHVDRGDLREAAHPFDFHAEG